MIDSLVIGGANKLTLEVIKLLDRDIFDVSLISLSCKNNIINFDKYNISEKNLIQLEFNEKITINNLLSLYFALKPYRIIISSLDISNFYCAIVNILYLKRKIFIAVFHGHDAIFTEEIDFKKIIKRDFSKKYLFLMKYVLNLLLKLYSGYIAVCEDTKYFLIKKRKLKSDKIKVIYHGLNITEIEKNVSDTSEVNINYTFKNKFVIGYAGRLTYGKGIDKLIYEFSNIVKIHKNVILFFLGEGELKEFIEYQSAKLDIKSSVYILPFQKNYLKFYKLFDILVLPSYSEGISIVLLEAMYNKTIVLTTNCGGSPELIQDGYNGYLFDYGNGKILVNKLLYIINNIKNMEHIKANARYTVKSKFSLEENIKYISEYFQNLVNH